MIIHKEIEEIEVKRLSQSSLNPRQCVGDIKELADNISQQGMIEPLIITEREGKYEVIVGERRRCAAVRNRLKTLPCRKAEGTDQELLTLIAGEESHRKEFNMVEKARLYSTMLFNGLTEKDIAKTVGLSQPSISGIISILKFKQKILDKIIGQPMDESQLTYTKLEPILRSSLPEEIVVSLIDRIPEEKMTQKEIREFITKYETEEEKSVKPKGSEEEGKKEKEGKDHPVTLIYQEPIPLKDLVAILREAENILGYIPSVKLELEFKNPEDRKTWNSTIDEVIKEKYEQMTNGIQWLKQELKVKNVKRRKP